MTKIDVIIGVRNEEKHLERCLTSLQNQNLSDIQILLLMGDLMTGHVILFRKNEKRSRIKLFDNPQMIISSARNIGIKASKQST